MGASSKRRPTASPGRTPRGGFTLGLMRWELFSDLPSGELQRVLTLARRRTFGRGEVVFHEGDPADSLHLISKGRFAVRVTTPLGETAMLAIRGPGEAFGELALVSEAPRSATIAALEPAETHSIYRREFDELRREHPFVNRVLVAVLAAEVRRMDELIVEAFYVGAEQRVLRRLCDLAAVYTDASDTVTIPLTQEDLAGLAGTSRATVNRALREEETRGTVKLGRGKTTVLNLEELRRRAH
jgi:CRP/FNR family cyclic AMP-dependent transcriptional regulator